ncbi:MAG: WD40 repeat domain-containing serine/threonine protein kinase [Ktedonobacteraceae bacterium]
MTTPPLLYCNNCGAANQKQATHCFACEKPLHTPTQETLLKQRYRIIGLAGQGGFGAVYKAIDTQSDNRPVAIKAINLSILTAQEVIEATEAFNREVLVLSGLAHPNLPRLYDHFTDTEHWYLVTDFIEGETLERYLDKTRHGRLLREEVIDIGIQLCTVLDYLHTRQPPIIFRDLKPSNVMRTPAGHLYLIDFGIARHFKPGQPRDTKALGSPGYAAPEQYGRAQTTPQADIYSLGAMLHQLLTGNDPAQTPFRFALFPLQDQSTLEKLRSLLLQMVAMDVNERPTSIVTVKQELEGLTVVSQPAGTLLTTYRDHNRLVLAAAWSLGGPPSSSPGRGSCIVSGSSDGTLHIWNAATGQNMFTYSNPSRWYAWACALAWSPDGNFIACGGDDKLVQVWQVENVGTTAVTMKHYFTYRGHSNWVNALGWSPDGSRIASASDDKTVQIWQVGNSRAHNQAEIYYGHTYWVEAVAWSPDGTRIASGGNDATIHVWDVTTKNTVLIYHGHTYGVNALAWSPDSTHVASCSWDNFVRVWDATTGKTVLIYDGHADWVNALAWSPDGTRIASASKDKTVQVWDATTGDTLITYGGHSRWVYAVAWSPDGTRIASGGNDKTVQVWQAV